MPRPKTLIGDTIRSESPFGSLYTTINCMENGSPYEVFLRVGKPGTDIMAVSEAYGRLISLCLKSGGKLEDVVEQLQDIGGHSKFNNGVDVIKSLPDAIAKVLRNYVGTKEELVVV